VNTFNLDHSFLIIRLLIISNFFFSFFILYYTLVFDRVKIRGGPMNCKRGKSLGVRKCFF